ncbi:hypothetical protein JCM8547_005501 [Rhodosporidiobolus lusitaniae]
MLPASPWVRWAAAVFVGFIVLHALGQAGSERYAHHTSFGEIARKVGLKDKESQTWYAGRRIMPHERWTPPVVEAKTVNGTSFNYPYVFLNNGDFSEDFRRRTSSLASGKTSYGKIPKEHWGDGFPESVNATLALEKINEMGKLPIPYAGSVPYRKMCRYQSGFFWRHPLLDGLDYYRRVEPSVKFYCDMDYDPFRMMKHSGKRYGFVVSLYEYQDTIVSYDTTKNFMALHPEHIASPNALDWISNDGGKTYNLCHFWSNFEIASLDLWRSEAYRACFDYLDKSGGFFYERCDPQSFLRETIELTRSPEEIHAFFDVDYCHEPFQHCPLPEPNKPPRCSCSPYKEENLYNHGYSCTPRWRELYMNPFKIRGGH